MDKNVVSAAHDTLRECGAPIRDIPFEAVLELLAGLQRLGLSLTPKTVRSALLNVVVFALDLCDTINHQ
jgi:hypothetical protein